jgi:hypothetical protein
VPGVTIDVHRIQSQQQAAGPRFSALPAPANLSWVSLSITASVTKVPFVAILRVEGLLSIMRQGRRQPVNSLQMALADSAGDPMLVSEGSV